jgi:hypothetical protein
MTRDVVGALIDGKQAKSLIYMNFGFLGQSIARLMFFARR